MTKQLALTLDIAGEAQSQDLQGSQFHNSSDGGFGIWLSNIMTVAMTLAAILVLFFMVWGAIEWITSGGEKGKIESGRNKISNAVVGLIVLAATTALFLIVEEFLNINVLTFN